MGACQSPANKRSKKTINMDEKDLNFWDENDVYNWLSTQYDGQLRDVATKFRECLIRGRVLEDINDKQLKYMGVKIGHRLLFKQLRAELFQRKGHIKEQKPFLPHTNIHREPRYPPRLVLTNDPLLNRSIPIPNNLYDCDHKCKSENNIHQTATASAAAAAARIYHLNSIHSTPITKKRIHLIKSIQSQKDEIFEIALFIHRNITSNRFMLGREVIILLKMNNISSSYCSNYQNINNKFIETCQLLFKFKHLIPQKNINEFKQDVLYTINLYTSYSRSTVSLTALNPNKFNKGSRVWVYDDQIKEWISTVILGKNAQNVVQIKLGLKNKYMQLPNEKIQLKLPYFSSSAL